MNAKPVDIPKQDPREALRALAKRIRAAGNDGRGVRLSAYETGLLTTYNLPCTGDSPDIMDGN